VNHPESKPESPEADLLDRLAAQLADGSIIDWDKFRADGVPERQIRAFRTLAMLRTAPREGDGHDNSDIPAGYEVLKLAGRGGYARVLKARDQNLGRTVALKILDPVLGATEADRERFLREARTMAQTEHPNVLKIFGLHTWPARDGPAHIALALEWVEGEDLARFVEKRGPLHPFDATRIGIDVCEALQALHDRGIVHRDVKPQNVMQRRGGNTVLLDFGIARRISDEEVILGSTAGTPAFEAPEVLGGSRPMPSSDLFSVGVLLYWLMTGMLPVPGSSAQEQREATQAGRFVPLWQCRTDVPREVSAVVARAMALRPDERPATAAELARQLRMALLPAARHHRSRARRAVTWALPAAALGAALGVLVGVDLGSGSDPADREPPRAGSPTKSLDPATEAHRWIGYPPTKAAPRNVVPRELAVGAFGFRVPYAVPDSEPPSDRRTLRCPDDYPTIQAAIDASQPFDRIVVGAGTWSEALSISAHPIELCSNDGPRVTRIDATGLDRAVIDSTGLAQAYASHPDWRDRPLVIRGLSITGGTGSKSGESDRHGGGIQLAAFPALVEHCVVYGNGLDEPTTFGGGIQAEGIATIRDCVVLGNAAWACGGGIFALGEKADVDVERCTVFGNSGRDLYGIQGGIASSHGGRIRVAQCIVWGNAGEQIGTFGPYGKGATQTVVDSVVAGESERTPLFADQFTGDLRLLPCSAGIGTDGTASHGALQAR
jgi:serine/threonine protein kinase